MIDYKGEVNPELLELWDGFFRDYYHDEIATAVVDGHESITVDYRDIESYNPDFADDLQRFPEEILWHGEKALSEYEIDAVLETAADVILRVGNLRETVGVSALRSDHRDTYNGVKGQVNKVSQVQPKTTSMLFRCERCSSEANDFEVGPIPQDGDTVNTPLECPGCERQGPFTILDEEAIDHQIVELADEPGKNPGTTSHTVPMHLYNDLAGTVKPGDRIQVNGLITTEKEQINGGDVSTRRPWRVKARAIDPEQVAFEEVTPEREDEIKELAANENREQLFIESLAPNIISNERGEKTKLAVILQMFGGNGDGKRGDINVFLVGDKGTGKSQILNRANELAPKSVKASGKGATAAGLTATATQSDYGDGWMLDAGALVLASGGLACIDEFDKMNDSARKSMHEAMEDQRVPINKAGINTVLETETAVLAAANPMGGDFDRYTPLTEQVNLESPLISRFDLIFGLQDTQDTERDREIAMHQHSETEDPPIDDDLFRQYVAYARNNLHPEYESDRIKERLVDYYVDKREEAADEEGKSTFGPRMNDALKRLAEASARMRLSDTINDYDAERAIRLMNRYIGDLMLDESGDLDPDKVTREESPRKQVMDQLDTKEWKYPNDVAREIKLSEQKTREILDSLMNSYNPPKVEEDRGKWRIA